MVENFPKRLIICASGNSVPFDNEKGLDKRLVDYLKTEFSMGLNMWYKFGCETTWTTWLDWQWYQNNIEDIKNLSLLIGKKDKTLSKLNIIQSNTILLSPITNKYHGKNSWNEGFYRNALVGFFALTLGIALDFKEIYLLGYDCCEIDGKTHFYQDKIDLIKKGKSRSTKYRGVGTHNINSNKKYKTSHYNNPDQINKWFDNYKVELDKIKIINVSEHSVINSFPKISYDEFFRILEEEPGKVLQSTAREKIRTMVEERMKK